MRRLSRFQAELRTSESAPSFAEKSDDTLTHVIRDAKQPQVGTGDGTPQIGFAESHRDAGYDADFAFERLANSPNHRSSTAPTEIAESATLNAGNDQSR